MPSKALENRQPIVHKTNMERLCKLVYLRHSFVNSWNNELCCFALLVFGRIKGGTGGGGGGWDYLPNKEKETNSPPPISLKAV